MNQFSLPKNMNLNMDGMDPCSIGPLTCGVHSEDVEHDEEMGSLQNLLSVAARKGRDSLKSAFRSNKQNDLVDVTKERISDFQSRGWLSQQETRKYMAILDTAPIQQGNKDHFEEYIRSELIRELDLLEAKMNGIINGSSSTSLRALSMKKKSAVAAAQPLGDATNKLNIRRKSEVILSAKDVAKQIGDEQIEELFVETCFFARLGFVQPPSCLKCAYRESIKGDSTTAKCNRWVAWRRDANHIIHPSYLLENTVFVQCHAARQLLAGQSVDFHQWDASKKALLFP